MAVNVTFGIIVLNGEPFIRYCIKALYPHAHEIIIAEGACTAAANVATPDGHSKDCTVEILKEIKRDEDPENKITIVTAEDEGYSDGFWPGEKLEQSQAFAKRATGNYLWQVDVDEFYSDEDIDAVKDMLNQNSSISCLSFKQFSFWGGFNYYVDSLYFKRFLPEIFRVFKWEEGSEYISHRPPTVINKQGNNVKDSVFINSDTTGRLGIYMYHYSFVFPKQIDEKVEYYRHVDWSKLEHTKWWAEEVYYKFSHPFKIFIIDEFPGWICRFKGKHPKAIAEMINDLNEGRYKIVLRQTDDIEKLLNTWWYGVSVLIIKRYYYFDMGLTYLKRKAKNIVKYVRRDTKKNSR